MPLKTPGKGATRWGNIVTVPGKITDVVDELVLMKYFSVAI